jgi:hypothetical protein
MLQKHKSQRRTRVGVIEILVQELLMAISTQCWRDAKPGKGRTSVNERTSLAALAMSAKAGGVDILKRFVCGVRERR